MASLLLQLHRGAFQGLHHLPSETAGMHPFEVSVSFKATNIIFYSEIFYLTLGDLERPLRPQVDREIWWEGRLLALTKQSTA